MLARAKGDVFLKAKDGAKEAPAEPGTPLEPGDQVRTAADSSAEILLEPDGIVSVRARTVFRLPDGSAKAAALDVGTVLLRLTRGGPHAAMSIRTAGAVAAVRGTEFAVELSSPGGPTAVGVFEEGAVAVSGVAADGAELGAVTLEPRQETTVEPGAAPAPPGPLRLLAQYRAAARALRGRLVELRREYRAFPQEKRRELREKLRGRPEDRP